ncbi:MAG TPA: hypothetical protein VG269_08465 [Tepidisphaeraceae bacterium]|jgi:hypothetical protein|nr:hypothetical protein [Tepidisphaeraceae bacterium]
MKLSYRSMAKFDAIAANVRRELSIPFEGLLVPPPRWEDQAYLFDADKHFVVFTSADEEVLRDFPRQQVALRDFVVIGGDVDFPLSETESHIFEKTVRMTDESFERQYQGDEWHPQVARLIVELKLASPATDVDAARRNLLSPLRDVFGAALILPWLPEPIDLTTADALTREFIRETSLFLPAELQLPEPLQEEAAVQRIRKCFPECPRNLIGAKKIRLAGAGPSQDWISFRVRQF